MDWFSLAFTSAIVICAIFAGRNDEQPYRVKMCLVESGPNGEDMTSMVWSDYIERYKERYPGSYCGSCGEEKACPSKKKK